ncbi:HNH endonuclease [Streptomyces sp. NBC_00178]|uniref:HNH endonuclease signature motif containing protein n=1 Tax=Streptomyces sp. NBC_00178 TaxID=2975672 RepID=UPI002E2C0548|nr:HNH endonuclease signature motif containing protein [Streptomyces sp. NBC_00178]
MPAHYTRELLEAAARETANCDDAVRWCGGTPTPGSRAYLRRKMAEERIDISHFADPRIRHTEHVLRDLVAGSTSVAEVVRRLGINPVGGNHSHISRRIAALGIDTSHFETRSRARRKRVLGSLLALRSRADGRVSGERLRRELLRCGVPELCAMCGTGAEWDGRPLRLEVDHIDGAWWDNRLENLRLLCPNCHSVTDTYRGRKRRKSA